MNALFTSRILGLYTIFTGITLAVLMSSYLFVVTEVSAQIPLGVEEQVSFDVVPRYPEPNETVSITITSYFTDLNKTNVSWYVNGSLYESGLGLRSIEIDSGDVGSTQNIRVVANRPNGSILEKTLTLTPSDIDLIREPLTYVHPFYKGKSLAPRESDALFVAIPNFFDSSGNKIPSDRIVFTWKIDGTVDGSESGVGRDTYYYVEDVISRPITVSVEASPVSSDISAREVKNFDYVEPKVLFYESNPLLGTLYNKELGDSINLISQEIEITSIPYFFNLNDLAALNFDWNLNNQKVDVSNFETVNKLVFRRTDENDANFLINLSVNNNNKLLQAADKTFNIYHDED
jgi:hypothetical protein